MKQFAALIKTIDSTNKTTQKVEALANYFRQAPDKDKVWAIAILSHRRPSRPVNSSMIRSFASELANIPLWLFEDSYHIVGDLAETIALVVPEAKQSTTKSLTDFIHEIIALKPKTEDEKKDYLTNQWMVLNYYERFVFTKLITGGFRIGVSQKLMTRALAKATEIEEDVLAYKLMGNWDPSKITFEDLILKEDAAGQDAKPYPFYLAYPVESEVEQLGNPDQFIFEHKWDGIRAQVIVRGGQVYIWSRGEELVTTSYPEFLEMASVLPDGSVLDGEILVYTEGKIGSFNDLQKRIGRKKPTSAVLKKYPVVLRAYDLLSYKGQDIRNEVFKNRREKLQDLHRNYHKQLPIFQLSEVYFFTSWEEAKVEREKSREKFSEGLMLKHKDSVYGVGRKKGDWWKWKSDPFSIDAVLTYAMRGHGRRSNLFTDYTFALWDDDKQELVTFAKAYSGLTDKEFKEIDAWIKKNTLERFGPVRSVIAFHVFEIAFEGIALSNRHKSGIATRFPRILRWRKDKKIDDANTINELKSLIP